MAMPAGAGSSHFADHAWCLSTFGRKRPYADPPYAGRHVDYFNSWSDKDEGDLAASLKKLPCRFLLSTWFQNKYRTNPNVEREWNASAFTINAIEHFYHVGPTESLRNPMTEALIANFAGVVEAKKRKMPVQRGLFDSARVETGEVAAANEPPRAQ
jgi:hypothetical protein